MLQFFYTAKIQKETLLLHLFYTKFLHIAIYSLFCNFVVSKKYRTMDIAEQIKKIRKEKGLSQQELADKLSMNRVQYNRIETGKSDPTMNILQRIATVLDINVVEFFEAKNNDTEVHTVNEPLLQKVKLLDELDEVQKNSICNMIDTAIANKRMKQALSNAMSITI